MKGSFWSSRSAADLYPGLTSMGSIRSSTRWTRNTRPRRPYQRAEAHAGWIPDPIPL